MRSAGEDLSLYKDHIDALAATRDIYVSQFDLGQRQLGDLLFIQQFLFEAQVRSARNLGELTSAEAWLLNALGKLDPDYIQRPGWP